VARILVVGEPGRARELESSGHVVEEADGVDPDRLATLTPRLEGVTVVCWLLGRVAHAPLHGPRLRMMLEKSVDTMVRGFAYEPPADAALRAQGLAVLQEAARTWEIPTAVIDGDPRARVVQLLR